MFVLLRNDVGGDERIGQESTIRVVGLSAYAQAARALPGPLLRKVEGLLELGDTS